MNTATAARPSVEAAEPQLAPVRLICEGPVMWMEEGGRRYIHIVGLKFMAKGKELVMDALLCPNYPNAGYPTKLYLTKNLGLGLNWNETAFILGRTWFTWSWARVPSNQPLISILADHLEAFR